MLALTDHSHPCIVIGCKERSKEKSLETVDIIPGRMMVAWTKTAAPPEVRGDQFQGETMEIC